MYKLNAKQLVKRWCHSILDIKKKEEKFDFFFFEKNKIFNEFKC